MDAKNSLRFSAVILPSLNAPFDPYVSNGPINFSTASTEFLNNLQAVVILIFFNCSFSALFDQLLHFYIVTLLEIEYAWAAFI